MVSLLVYSTGLDLRVTMHRGLCYDLVQQASVLRDSSPSNMAMAQWRSCHYCTHPSKTFWLPTNGVCGVVCQRARTAEGACTEKEIGWFGWGVFFRKDKVCCGDCTRSHAESVSKGNNSTTNLNWYPPCSACLAASQGFQCINNAWVAATAQEMCSDMSFIMTPAPPPPPPPGAPMVPLANAPANAPFLTPAPRPPPAFAVPQAPVPSAKSKSPRRHRSRPRVPSDSEDDPPGSKSASSGLRVCSRTRFEKALKDMESEKTACEARE